MTPHDQKMCGGAKKEKSQIGITSSQGSEELLRAIRRVIGALYAQIERRSVPPFREAMLTTIVFVSLHQSECT